MSRTSKFDSTYPQAAASQVDKSAAVVDKSGCSAARVMPGGRGEKVLGLAAAHAIFSPHLWNITVSAP